MCHVGHLNRLKSLVINVGSLITTDLRLVLWWLSYPEAAPTTPVVVPCKINCSLKMETALCYG